MNFKILTVQNQLILILTSPIQNWDLKTIITAVTIGVSTVVTLEWENFLKIPKSATTQCVLAWPN